MSVPLEQNPQAGQIRCLLNSLLVLILKRVHELLNDMLAVLLFLGTSWHALQCTCAWLWLHAGTSSLHFAALTLAQAVVVDGERLHHSLLFAANWEE